MIDPRTRLLLEDMLSNYAAARAVEIVGEAAAQIEPEVQKSLPSIPWRQAIGMRNKLIHGYRSLNSKTLYETIRDDFSATDRRDRADP